MENREGDGQVVVVEEASEAADMILNDLEVNQWQDEHRDLHEKPLSNARVPKVEYHQPIIESFGETAPSETVDDTIEPIVPNPPRQPRVARGCRPQNRYHSASLQLGCTPISILNTPTPRLRRRRPINPIPSVETTTEHLFSTASISVAIEDAPFSQTMTPLDETSRIPTGSKCKQRDFPIVY